MNSLFCLVRAILGGFSHILYKYNNILYIITYIYIYIYNERQRERERERETTVTETEVLFN
jgi:hypothetical protein